jgi:hypothetical protein
VDGFGSRGFLSDYQDFRSSPNQVRHFMGALLAGMSQGKDDGLAIMNRNETDPVVDGAADIRLNNIAVPLGAELQSHNSAFGGVRSSAGRDRMHQLASDVEKRICDPSVQ